MRKWDLSHTVDEKVLMHLWDHSTLKDEREAPFEVTQHGIAAAVGIIRSAVPRSVKKLVEKGYIEEKLAHVGRLTQVLDVDLEPMKRFPRNHIPQDRRRVADVSEGAHSPEVDLLGRSVTGRLAETGITTLDQGDFRCRRRA